MERYVIPPIFNLDFKFPASLLLLQQLRQIQKSQRLSQLRYERRKFLTAGRPAERRNFVRHGRPASRAGYRSIWPRVDRLAAENICRWLSDQP